MTTMDTKAVTNHHWGVLDLWHFCLVRVCHFVESVNKNTTN